MVPQLLSLDLLLYLLLKHLLVFLELRLLLYLSKGTSLWQYWSLLLLLSQVGIGS